MYYFFKLKLLWVIIDKIYIRGWGMKLILESSKKIVLALLCCFSFSLVAMEVEPEGEEVNILPVENEQEAVQKEQKEAEATGKTRARGQRRGYKIRCRGGKCWLKGRKGGAIPPKIQDVANKLEKTEAAKAKEAATFKFVCDKNKCGIKRKGLRRGKGKIRCKGGYCRIKGKGRGRWGMRRKQQFESYRKRLEATKKGKQAAPATYKLNCDGQKCDIKQKAAGKKWGGRRRQGRRGRRMGYRRGRTA